MAILYREDRFLLQLRDDFPHILYPGHWGFFGGHIEVGETPESGLIRELEEEITYKPTSVRLFRTFTNSNRYAYIYSVSLTVTLDQLQQNEGQDMTLADLDAIKTGTIYSQKLQEYRPMGEFHQKVLLEFAQKEIVSGI